MKHLAKDLKDLTPEDVQPLVAQASRYAEEAGHIVMGSSSFGLRLCDGCDNIHLWLKNDEDIPFATMTISLDQVDDICHTLIALRIEATGRILKRRLGTKE